MQYYGFGSPGQCLDEEFDAPDLEADDELCRALVAGRAGLHPDGWGNHDPLPLRWLLRKRPEVEVAYTPLVNYTTATVAKIATNVVQRRKEWERERKRPAVIPVLLGPDPPGTWTTPYPKRSQIPAPEAEGDRAGEHDRHEQHR